ncbi:MAG TPA: hypothetical protein VGU46_11395 [Acidobacteriaceae bacterium]|nr:hypothetical protein [Acidobacteriaceae bacterium]
MKLFSVKNSTLMKERLAGALPAVDPMQRSDSGRDTSSPVADGPQAAACTQASTELLYELQSAASMVMDREECEALMKEIQALHQPRPVAA